MVVLLLMCTGVPTCFLESSFVISCLLPVQCSPLKIGSTLEGKKLLLEEQVLSFYTEGRHQELSTYRIACQTVPVPSLKNFSTNLLHFANAAISAKADSRDTANAEAKVDTGGSANAEADT